ncbi:head GIN domain-containing protein [Carboxylicivirga sp. N1Y90]|uniref:head GIN domain-containing protein n=1 Tax=Carboxylicivirga fragile TaxID=3417571 RepID=UPI003D3303F5|nr:DUF2807 domain-containing protein [Marinilabiliaceae bacterium N1Y90]
MKKYFGTLLLISLISLGFNTIQAQEKENRTIGDFTKIEVSSGINLYITQGDEIDLLVESEKSELHKIITKVDNGTLRIYNKNSYNWGMKKAPKVRLTFKEISSISCNGGADVYSQNTIKAENLRVTTSGGADAYLDVVCNDVSLKTSGGSDIKIKGTTKNLKASASGGSDIHANDLKALVVEVNTSGGADASVWAVESISAKASGGGDIDYHGNPKVKNITESGGGDITQK